MVINGFLWFRTGFRWFRRGRKWFLRIRHSYRVFPNGYRVFKTGYREYENYENQFGTKNVVRYFCIAVYTALGEDTLAEHLPSPTSLRLLGRIVASRSPFAGR